MNRLEAVILLICLAISAGAGVFVANYLASSLGATRTLSAYQYYGGAAFIWLIGIVVFLLVFAVLLFATAPRRNPGT